MNDPADNAPPAPPDEPTPEAPSSDELSPGIGDLTPYDFETPAVRKGFWKGFWRGVPWAPKTTIEMYLHQFLGNLKIELDSSRRDDQRTSS